MQVVELVGRCWIGSGWGVGGVEWREMVVRVLIAAAAAATARCAMGNPAEATGFDESKVINMQPEAFDEQVKKLAPVLVDFYACVPAPNPAL